MKLTCGTEQVVLGYCAGVHIQGAGIDHLWPKLAQCPHAQQAHVHLQLILQQRRHVNGGGREGAWL